MILLDTHEFIWWIHDDKALPNASRRAIIANEATGLAISVITCWEIAKKVEIGKLELTMDVSDWIHQALAYPGVSVLNLTPAIAIESARLPQPFHRDPADQIIVATSRVLDIPLLTEDARIKAYPYVRLAL